MEKRDEIPASVLAELPEDARMKIASMRHRETAEMGAEAS